MQKEVLFALNRQQEVLESLKPRLGRFIQEKLNSWGLGFNDIRLVDEAAFGYTGIPIYGPELARTEQGWNPHIDFGVREDLYTGPKSEKEKHPLKILIPPGVYSKISAEYGLDIQDLIKGRLEFFALPTVSVDLDGIKVLVPEPAPHIKEFAAETLLNYSLEQVGERKLREWFEKVKAVRDVGQHLHKFEVATAAEEMIKLSLERWSETARQENWNWLNE